MTKVGNIAAEMLIIFFHPLIIPLIGLMYSLQNNTFVSLLPLSYQIYIYLIMFIAIFLIPMASMPILKNIGTISEYKLENHKERIFPAIMVLIGLYFVFKTYNGFQIPLPKELRILLLLLVATDILVLIGSFLFKFSLRTLVFSVILGYVFVNNYFSYRNSLLLYSLLILFMGANASFELKQNKNSLREVTVSFAIGILLSSSFVLLLLN